MWAYCGSATGGEKEEQEEEKNKDQSIVQPVDFELRAALDAHAVWAPTVIANLVCEYAVDMSVAACYDMPTRYIHYALVNLQRPLTLLNYVNSKKELSVKFCRDGRFLYGTSVYSPGRVWRMDMVSGTTEDWKGPPLPITPDSFVGICTGGPDRIYLIIMEYKMTGSNLVRVARLCFSRNEWRVLEPLPVTWSDPSPTPFIRPETGELFLRVNNRFYSYSKAESQWKHYYFNDMGDHIVCTAVLPTAALLPNRNVQRLSAASPHVLLVFSKSGKVTVCDFTVQTVYGEANFCVNRHLTVAPCGECDDALQAWFDYSTGRLMCHGNFCSLLCQCSPPLPPDSKHSTVKLFDPKSYSWQSVATMTNSHVFLQDIPCCSDSCAP